MNDSYLKDRLEVAVESNEKYRSRARAVSTLCAAAVGALAAGLLLAPAEAIPKLAQVLGLIAIVLLIASTALSLAASTASSYQAGAERKVDLHALEVWKIRTKSPRDRPFPATYEDRLEDAETIKNGINKVLSWGLWAASVAAIFLVASLVVATFLSNSSRLVTLELETPANLNSCPRLGQMFTGKVRDRDRTSNNSLLPVVVSGRECGNADGATLYLDKSYVTIVG